MPALVDLHCHMLPGIDDGAQTIEDTQALLAASRRGGVKRIVFTPHFYPDKMDVPAFLSGRLGAVQKMRALPEAQGLAWRCGAEIAYVPFFDRLPLEQLTFGSTSYLLMELDTRYLQPGVDEAIRAAVDRGLRPILAHVERYVYLEQDPTLLYHWVKAGALAQVNAGYVLRDAKSRKRTLQLAGWNLIHFMASDAHSVSWRPPLLAEGYEKLPAELAEQFQRNAADIFAGNPVERDAPVRPEHRWNGWK